MDDRNVLENNGFRELELPYELTPRARHFDIIPVDFCANLLRLGFRSKIDA